MYAVIGTQKSSNTGLGIFAATDRHAQRDRGKGYPGCSHSEGSQSLKPGQWYAGIAFGGSVLFVY